MSHTKPPGTSRIARSAVAGATAVKLGARTLRHRLNQPPAPDAQARHDDEIGRLLFQAMNQLRGTALKAAQVLSLQAGFLPEGVRAQLARASHQALPLNRALVSRAFRTAFGQEPEARFAHFEPDAFAAASLGQVHRARLADGRPVAVKLQYPGIATTIDSDLSLLRGALRALRGGRLVLPPPEVLDGLIGEIRRQLLEEVDYTHEAAQQQWFAQHTAAPGIVMSQVLPEHSHRTVLTQTLLPGRHLPAWLATDPPQALRDRQGQALFDWFTRCAFVHGRIHTDLNPGNLLFQSGGDVAVLDFGATQALSAPFTRGLAAVWLAWLQHGEQAAPALLPVYRQMGMVAPEVGVDSLRRHLMPLAAPVLRWATEPLATPTFDFSHKLDLPLPAHDAWAAREGTGLLRLPPELPSFDRAWLGLMHALQGLKARVDTRAARALVQAAAG